MIDRSRNKDTRDERLRLLQLMVHGLNLDKAAKYLNVSRRRVENHLDSLKTWNRAKTNYQLLALALSDGTIAFDAESLKKRPYEKQDEELLGEKVATNAGAMEDVE